VAIEDREAAIEDREAADETVLVEQRKDWADEP
jgi:hypothetical protein